MGMVGNSGPLTDTEVMTLKGRAVTQHCCAMLTDVNTRKAESALSVTRLQQRRAKLV